MKPFCATCGHYSEDHEQFLGPCNRTPCICKEFKVPEVNVTVNDPLVIVPLVPKYIVSLINGDYMVLKLTGNSNQYYAFYTNCESSYATAKKIVEVMTEKETPVER